LGRISITAWSNQLFFKGAAAVVKLDTQRYGTEKDGDARKHY
jgi:hypothetical protein